MKNLFMSAALAVALAAPASAATLVSYVSTNTPGSLAPTFEAAGVTGLDLSRGSGIVQNVAGLTYNSKGWTEADLTAALGDNDYLEFGFSSANTYDMTSLDIRYDRSGTGPMQIELFASTDGALYSSIFSDPSVGVNGEVNTIDLSSFAGVMGLTFHLFGWGAGNSGTFDIENAASFGGNGIRINGTQVAAVPLPAGLPLLAVALGMIGLVRRTRDAA
jgi:hypothetical protein